MRGIVYWLIPLAAFLYILHIINLVRQRKLLEIHALLWLVTFVAVAVSPFLVPVLDRFALWVGIVYSPTLYLLIAIFFLMSNVLNNTLDISRLTQQNRRLTQEVAILRRQVETGEKAPLTGSAAVEAEENRSEP
jgi:hypothetical protein